MNRRADIITKPVLVVEVPSESAEGGGRGDTSHNSSIHLPPSDVALADAYAFIEIAEA